MIGKTQKLVYFKINSKLQKFVYFETKLSSYKPRADTHVSTRGSNCLAVSSARPKSVGSVVLGFQSKARQSKAWLLFSLLSKKKSNGCKPLVSACNDIKGKNPRLVAISGIEHTPMGGRFCCCRRCCFCLFWIRQMRPTGVRTKQSILLILVLFCIIITITITTTIIIIISVRGKLQYDTSSVSQYKRF